MIQPQTIVKVADNSGAKIGRVFKILGSSKKRYARIGELVIFSVQKAEPRKEIKKKAVLLGLVVRQKEMILVKGVNKKKLHKRPKKSKEKGKIIEQATPVHISNVKKVTK